METDERQEEKKTKREKVTALVVDFSSPHIHDPDVGGSAPVSVNDGIRIEDFPCGGSSTKDVLKRLNLFGRGCTITKQDWSDAYKGGAICEWSHFYHY